MSGLSSTRNPERRGGSEVGVTRPLPLLKPETKFFWTAGRDGGLGPRDAVDAALSAPSRPNLSVLSLT